MNVRLVTVATFDMPHKAELAKIALEEAGIRAEVNDREIVAMDWLLLNAVGGIKVQVAETDAERALVVLEPFNRPGKFRQPVSDEELERQALAAPTEDEVRASQAAPGRSPDTESSETESDRERQASRALWWMVGGIFCTPAWAVGMYYLLTAAFRSGPLSANGRINLRVAGVLGAVITLLVVLVMTRGWNKLNP
jgi:hypothetical protein